MDGDIEVDGAIVAASPSAVDKVGVEQGVDIESLGGATDEGADGEDDAVAAHHGSVFDGFA